MSPNEIPTRRDVRDAEVVGHAPDPAPAAESAAAAALPAAAAPAPPRRTPDPARQAAVREAMTLPWLFLAATLLASVRIAGAGTLAFEPPSLMALVLGVLCTGLVTQVGVAHVPALVSSRRLGLENACGVVVLALLLLASAQVITMLTPSRGIFAVVVSVYFLLLFLSTLAARPEPDRVLRSLAVTFGGALLLKFVVLSGLTAQGGTLATRLLATALEGVTLGALGAQFQPASAGYLAFGALLLFFVGLSLLPRRQ